MAASMVERVRARHCAIYCHDTSCRLNRGMGKNVLQEAACLVCHAQVVVKAISTVGLQEKELCMAQLQCTITIIDRDFVHRSGW
jgi:hypothetical protein